MGRLEIAYGGVWGTVCNDVFNGLEASIVCRQLGMSGGRVLTSSEYSTAYGGPIWLDNVKCQGNERNLLECRHLPVGEGDCAHYEDIGISCYTL